MLLIDQQFDSFSHFCIILRYFSWGSRAFSTYPLTSKFCDSKKLNIDISNVLNRPKSHHNLHVEFGWIVSQLCKVQRTGRYTLFVTFPIILSFKHVMIDMALLKFISQEYMLKFLIYFCLFLCDHVWDNIGMKLIHFVMLY